MRWDHGELVKKKDLPRARGEDLFDFFIVLGT